MALPGPSPTRKTLLGSENDQGNHEDDYQMSRLKKTFEHDPTPLYLFDDIPQYSTLTL